MLEVQQVQWIQDKLHICNTYSLQLINTGQVYRHIACTTLLPVPLFLQQVYKTQLFKQWWKNLKAYKTRHYLVNTSNCNISSEWRRGGGGGRGPYECKNIEKNLEKQSQEFKAPASSTAEVFSLKSRTGGEGLSLLCSGNYKDN